MDITNSIFVSYHYFKRFSGIILINSKQKDWKPNNLKVFENNKIKGRKQDSQIRLWLLRKTLSKMNQDNYILIR